MRALNAIAVCTLAVAFVPAHAQTDRYPTRPVRMLIPYTPGGPTDLVGRAVGAKLQEAWGQQIVIDNRPGANGVIATEIVARAAPDGYTLLLGTPGQLVLLPLLSKSKLPFDAFADFIPASRVVISPQVLVGSVKLPVTNVPELIAYAKARPGQLNYASVQTGGTGHLGMELLKQATGIDMLHVPYKGTAPAITDIIGGQVQFMFTSLPSVLQQVNAGRIRLLATGAPKRSPAIPDTPTVSESVPGYELMTWYGMYLPKRTPPDIVNRVHLELVRILALPEIAQQFAQQGVEPSGSTSQELTATMRAETERWRQVIQRAGIKLDP
jgi:tripartite-type tricarboxylate transporter receptor subunit TctC